jgi:hypothetical protein
MLVPSTMLLLEKSLTIEERDSELENDSSLKALNVRHQRT